MVSVKKIFFFTYLFIPLSTEKKKKKEAQCESCELSFIGGKMRAIDWETAFQGTLRNCSKEVGQKSVLYMISVKGVHAVKHRSW